MSFILEVQKNGKDIILYENNKYRETYAVKSGEMVWRCLGRICKASIRTNSEKTVIHSANGNHNGPHPVTMRALQTPTPPHRRRRSGPTTPAAEPAPHTSSPPQQRRCPASTTLAADNLPNHTATNPKTPEVNHAIEPLTLSLLQDDGDEDLICPPKSEIREGLNDIRAENTALREELAKLRAEMKVILDHSIESDQRLIQYTEDVFLPPPSAASTSAEQRKTLCAKEELETARTTIKKLEETIMRLRHPCELCVALKEETKNMIETLRCLEAENQQLKNDILSNSKVPLAATQVQNRFQILGDEDENQIKEDFVTVVNKKRRKNQPLKSNFLREKTVVKKRTKNIVTESYLSTPFSYITVMGDSHVRNLASLIKRKLTGTTISGMCKPGACLRDVKPTSAPPRDHCYVLMAGTNDIDAGREDDIFAHLEDLLTTLKKSSSVLVVPLTTRHDIDPCSPVHDTVSLVNNFMAELCHRHQGVEILDTSSIRRQHYTTHGLHLRTSGKRVLADLISETLAGMRLMPKPRLPLPRPSSATAMPPPAVMAPITQQLQTYAEAVAQSTSYRGFPSQQEMKDNKENCEPVF